jgi:hypothetical protein
MRTLKCPLVLAAFALQASRVVAQTPDTMAMMQQFQAALGVNCDFCHGRGMGRGAARPAQETPIQPAQPPSHLEIARGMMAMMKELNEKMIPAATRKEAAANTRIQCVTCHRGVAIPGQLSDIITQTVVKSGADAAAAQYRDLRKQYYGRQSYDFGEETLITSASGMTNRRPDDAIALLKLNLEFYPQSTRTYTTLAYTYTRIFDDASAIEVLEKALEIAPDNSIVKGQLEQLKGYQRKR